MEERSDATEVRMMNDEGAWVKLRRAAYPTSARLAGTRRFGTVRPPT
jgi:hypothetical protein